MKDEFLFKIDNSHDNQKCDIFTYIYGYSIQKFLINAGLHPNHKILDLSNGNKDFTLWLAQYLEPLGQVVVVNPSEAILNSIQKKAYSMGLKNIVYHCKNFYEIDQINFSEFDLVFSRWLYSSSEQPLTLANNIYHKLKNKGLYIAVEPNFNDLFVDPDSRIIHEMKELYFHILFKNGFDPFIADKMCSLLYSSKFSPLHVELFQPILTSTEEKSILISMFQSLKESFLKYGLLNEFQFNERSFHLDSCLSQCYFVGGMRNTMISAIKKQE